MSGNIDVSLRPIERDEDFDRAYIPLPAGWEVQTKGRGSSFRIANTKDDNERLNIPPSPYLYELLERMAREIHAAHRALLDRAEKAEADNAAKQARIDALMLEYCPDEMTPEQLDEWGRNQVATRDREQAERGKG